METFKDTIGLWVKGSGGDVGHVEKGGKIGPKGGNKLGASVRSHGMGNTKTGNPSGAKSISTGMGGRGRKRNSLDQACGPINDGENVGMTLRKRKGSYEINMNVGKTAGRNRNRSRWWRNVFVNLGSLARNMLSGPEVDVTSHTVPKEMEWTCWKICWRKGRGIRGRKVGVEMSPRRERVGERGIEEIWREGRSRRRGMEGHFWCSWAMSE
jgi:hypothetical protein